MKKLLMDRNNGVVRIILNILSLTTLLMVLGFFHLVTFSEEKTAESSPRPECAGDSPQECLKRLIRGRPKLSEFSKLKVPNLSGRPADDPVVIESLRNTFILPPSTLPYNLTMENKNLDYDPSAGQTKIITDILKGRKNGFFVEVGGYNGEQYSNSLYLERKLNWTGILLEANPKFFTRLTMKRRKCYSSNTCLSPQNTAQSLVFTDNFMAGKIYNGELHTPTMSLMKLTDQDDIAVHRTYCFPLYSYMLALNRTKIDYFSLDVEGVEFDVLKTIPFDKLDIETLSVEYTIDKSMKPAIIELMKSKGYFLYATFEKKIAAGDFIFVKKGRKASG